MLAALCAAPAAQAQQAAEPPADAAPTAQAAQAAQADILQLRAIARVEHDTNVLRAPKATKQSDQIGSLAVGVNAEKRISLQRFSFDGEVTTYKFQDHSDLDYTTLNYLAAWRWSVTPALNGTLSSERREYRDVVNTVEGVNRVGRRTDRSDLLEAAYEIDGAWRAHAGASYISSRSSESNSFGGNPSVRSVTGGASYEYPSGTTFTARLRRGEGEYNDIAVPDTFNDNELALLVRWPVTPKTTVDGRIAYLRRTHDTAPARDFDGAIGSATVRYDLTAKTRVVAGLTRDLIGYEQNTGGHVESTRIFVAPVWKPTTQTAVNLRYDREVRNWRDTAASAPDNGRRDVLQTLSAGVEYEPRRAVTLSAAIRNERRNSNFTAISYRATVVAFAAKVVFF